MRTNSVEMLPKQQSHWSWPSGTANDMGSLLEDRPQRQSSISGLADDMGLFLDDIPQRQSSVSKPLSPLTQWWSQGTDARNADHFQIGTPLTSDQSGLDVAEVYKEYGNRVFDVHLKDKIVSSGGEGHNYTDVDIGEGDANFKGLFKALKATGYAGRLAIETDQELADPTKFVEGAIAFVKENSQ